MVLNDRIALELFVLLLKYKIWCYVYMNSFTQVKLFLNKLQAYTSHTLPLFFEIYEYWIMILNEGLSLINAFNLQNQVSRILNAAVQSMFRQMVL